MKKYSLALLWVILSLYGLYAKVPVVVADMTANDTFLDKQDEKFYTNILFDNLYTQIGDRDYTYLLVRTIGGSNLVDWKIRNEIDAFAVINEIDLNYLLYGSIISVDGSFESVFRMYSRKDEKVIKEISYRRPAGDRAEFIKETSFKINLVVYELLKQEIKSNGEKIAEDVSTYYREKELKDRFKGFRLHEYLGFDLSLGYPIPCGEWNRLFFGIADLETGIRLVRLPYLYKDDFFKMSLRPGFTFSYTLAKNQASIVEEYMNSFAFRFPAELLMAFNDKYIINAYLDLHFRVDAFYQNLYNIQKNYYSSSTWGWAMGCGFEYEIDKDGLYTIGLNNLFDFAVYDVFYFDFKLQPYFVIKFKETKQPEKIEVNDLKIKL